MLGLAQDQRRLGVAVRRIAAAQPGLSLELTWDSERFVDGFYAPEPAERHRWTTGEAVVPRALSARLRAGAVVELQVNGTLWYPVGQAAPLSRAAAA
jgi:hypothetical protein